MTIDRSWHVGKSCICQAQLYGKCRLQTTADDAVARLNHEIKAGLADARLKAKLEDVGGMLIAGSPAEFGKLIANETEKWPKVVKFANVKPE